MVLFCRIKYVGNISRSQGYALKKIMLKIDGMSCSACSSSIEKSLSRKKYIKNISVNLIDESASIEFDDGIATLEEIEFHIEKLGYKSKPYGDNVGVDSALRFKKLELGIVIFFGALLFILGMGDRKSVV